MYNVELCPQAMSQGHKGDAGASWMPRGHQMDALQKPFKSLSKASQFLAQRWGLQSVAGQC